VPRTLIHDVSIFNRFIPGQEMLSLQAGTGEIEARLEVERRIAAGTLDLLAEEIVLETRDQPIYGDLEVHANLAEGDLPAKRFNFSGTTIRLDNIVGEEFPEKKREKLEAWYCDVELQQGYLTFGNPLEAEGQVRLKMYDTRPIVAMLKDLGNPPGWLKLMPNIKDIDGTMEMDFGRGRIEVDDLVLAGKGLEVLGWLHVLDKKATARLFIKKGIVAAGIALDLGKAKVQLAKPRKWFEEQQSPRSEGGG
jgi:hypothetical protein